MDVYSEIENKTLTINKQKIRYMDLIRELQNKEKQIQAEPAVLEQQLNEANDTLKRLMANERSKLVRKHKLLLPLRLVGNLLRFLKHPLQYYRMRRDTLIVRRSGLFDDAYYLSQHSDLYLTTVDMLQHFMLYGAKEGRSPSSLFNTKFYLNANPDVYNAGLNPLIHYILHGSSEGRSPIASEVAKCNSELIPFTEIITLPSLKTKKSINTINQFDYSVLANSGIVWSDFFSFNNIVSSMDPIEYYIINWKNNNLKINNYFETDLYLDNYPDIANTGINPLAHYVQYGIKEKRIGYFDENKYFTEGKIKYDHQKLTYVIACHESSATGAPLVGLNIGIQLKCKYNIVFLIVRADNLHDSFLENCTLAVDNLLYIPNKLLKKIFEKINILYPIEAVICNSIVSMPILEAASQLKIPTVTLLHEFSCYSKPIGQVAKSIILSDRVIVPATIIKKSALDELHKHFTTKNNPPNITIAPQGKLPFIPDGFGDNFSVEELHQQLKITNSTTKVILGAGYIQIRKGVDLFISVSEKINQYYGGDVRFVWVGDGYAPEVDYNYSLWLKIQLDSSNIKDKFTFLPHQKNLDNILKITDCFLLTSRLDPFPNVVIDALYDDVYVACFENTAGSAEFMQKHNAVGDVVPYMDVNVMAERVSNYLSLDQNEINKRKGVNSAIVKKHLSFDNYISIIEKEIVIAKAQVAKRLEIEELILNSECFDKKYFRYLSNSNDAIDFYVKSTLKGIHLSDPIPGFSGLLWMNNFSKGNHYMVPLYGALQNEQKPVTHNCLILTGEKKAASFRIAVHIHLFYTDLADEFATYLLNIT